jgi:hypothetical protein
MAKVYPLEIEEMRESEDGDVLGYYSKGHHDDAAFNAALQAFLGETIPLRLRPRREWFRCACYGQDRVFDTGKPGQRGSFPITCVDDW